MTESDEKQLELWTTSGVDSRRRYLLSLLPVAALACISATLSTAAKRFLQVSAASISESQATVQKWRSVGSLSELHGVDPIMRTLTLEREAGWAITTEQQVVYVLPKDNYRVVSAICPHEGCPVLWDDREKNFLCPCHDSRFDDRGARLTGPASSDLAALPTMVEGDMLRIQLQG